MQQVIVSLMHTKCIFFLLFSLWPGEQNTQAKIQQFSQEKVGNSSAWSTREQGSHLERSKAHLEEGTIQIQLCMPNDFFYSRVNGRQKGLSPNGQKCSTYPQFSYIPNVHIIFNVLYIFVFMLLIMPDTYLWSLAKLFFFLVKVFLLICLLIDLHNSVSAVTFTTAFLNSKHRKKTQM